MIQRPGHYQQICPSKQNQLHKNENSQLIITRYMAAIYTETIIMHLQPSNRTYTKSVLGVCVTATGPANTYELC